MAPAAKLSSQGIRGWAQAASSTTTASKPKNIAKTRYVNDKQITDHYAIIPTGQGFGAMKSLNQRAVNVYEVIVRRFLSVFYPPAVYQKVSLAVSVTGSFQEGGAGLEGKEQPLEQFFASFKVLSEEGYLKIMHYSFQKKKQGEKSSGDREGEEKDSLCDRKLLEHISALKKKDILEREEYEIKEGETSPPKRYNSGSMILAMENAGQLIEDEELRAQIKGSGIGTSATRAEILKKLVNNKYLALNKKTQIITPTLMGEMIFDVVNASIKSLLNPELTASWEKGLTYVSEGSITTEEYMKKLTDFVKSRTRGVLGLNNQYQLQGSFDRAAQFYKTKKTVKK